jgi:molybdate transport system substrate-binding protein
MERKFRGNGTRLRGVQDLFTNSVPMRFIGHWLVILAMGIASLSSAFSVASDEVPAVAAASDLKFALEEISNRFRVDTRQDVKLVFGSSGNFYQQIAQGAPFQVYLSADEEFIFRLADAGKTADRGTLYAIGRIVLFAPHGSSLKVDAELSGLKAELAVGQIQHFAIANPEHAPYGRAAEQVLKSRGLWDALQPKLVLGENVSQAAQFATSGSAQGGIFAYSLALSPKISALGSYILLPEELHQPLRQRMALIKGANDTAQKFYRYLQQPVAREIFKRYGFALPGEQ